MPCLIDRKNFWVHKNVSILWCLGPGCAVGLKNQGFREHPLEDAQVVGMLVRRCVAGDAAAWEEIVQNYNRRIYNICYRFAGSATMPKT